jgi:nucleotide-binding universal stress UspA family protein
MKMNKILVPVVFREASLRMVHQAAYLARHFHSEIILLHVVTPSEYPAGFFERGDEIKERDLHAETVRLAQQQLDQAFRSELDGLAVKRLLRRGHAAREIAQVARDENTDLIVLSSYGYGPFYRLLLGSVMAKVLHETELPVWIGAHMEEEAPVAGDFAIRNVLCAVDFDPHAREVLAHAAQLAGEFGARLAVAHVTPSVEIYGPGGSHVVPEFKEAVVGYASEEIAKLQQAAGTNGEVIIESGDTAKRLRHIIEQTKADLLVLGHTPARGHLGENGNGYSIIRDARIPVLSV